MPNRRRNGTSAAKIAAIAVLLASLVSPVSAATTDDSVQEPRVDLQIDRRQVVANGYEFGDAGAYEKLIGTLSFEVDPDDPRNAQIVDLEKAPRNDRGMVEYETDFYLLRPVDLAKWNRKLFFEVNNRGNKVAVRILNDARFRPNDPTDLRDFGNGFMLERGYAIAWAGWQGDVLPGGSRLTVRLPIPTEADGNPITQKIVVELHDRFITSDDISCLPISGRSTFASYPAVSTKKDVSEAVLRVRSSDSTRPPTPAIPEGAPIPNDRWWLASNTEVCVDGAFDPSMVYELEYLAQDPRVMGLGYAATRDVVSFLRHRDQDSDGDANPLAGGGGITHVLGEGISSSGLYLRDFLYQGFNEDIAGRRVFDGVNIHVSGAQKLFLNYRFAQPNPYSTQHRDRNIPYLSFPFNYGVRTDPLTGRADGILKRPSSDPLVIHSTSGTEYWQFQAGLVSTDGRGGHVPQPANVREYLLSSMQHGSYGSPPTLGKCQQGSNSADYRPTMRALTVVLDQWVTGKAEPPPSRRPTVQNASLVTSDQASTGFPAIPGVHYNGLYNDAGERDFGPNVRGNRGVVNNWRMPPVLADYDVLVPRVDRIGIDVDGVKSPDTAAPLATYTGWNLQSNQLAEGDVCDLSGMTIPLPETSAEAVATGDPRPSLKELYGTHGGYVAAMATATTQLVKQRLLLREDADLAIDEAAASDVLRR